VLDTWFSSALWTFSTLGWPDETEDIKIFHPTSFMSPGYEILQLWVSRMILMGTFHLGQIPFRTVLIHGLVRDKDGRKFSKSLGNGIDPIDMIAKYGADALRMSLMVASPIGGDIRFDESKVKAYKNFANKLWNISRFIFSNTEGVAVDEALITAPADMQLIQEFKGILADITSDFEAYRFHLASEKLYHYIWHRLADEIIEESKTVLIEDEKQSRQQTLLYILKHSLIALHPFMPFITEEIWAHVPGTNTSLLMVEKWPKV